MSKGKINMTWILGIIILIGIVFTATQVFDITDSERLLYNYQCLDVEDKLNSGWSVDKIDSDGCTVVKKRVLTTSVNIGCASKSSGCSNCGDRRCSEMGLSLVGTYYTSCWSGQTGATCGAYGNEYYGGAQKVVNQCDFGANDLIWAQTFNEGTYTTADFEFQPKSFCRALVAIVVDEGSTEGVTTTELYQDIADTGSFSVNAGKKATLFYVTEKNTFIEKSGALDDKLQQINELKAQIDEYDADISILSATLDNLFDDKAELELA